MNEAALLAYLDALRDVLFYLAGDRARLDRNLAALCKELLAASERARGEA